MNRLSGFEDRLPKTVLAPCPTEPARSSLQSRVPGAGSSAAAGALRAAAGQRGPPAHRPPSPAAADCRLAALLNV